MCYTGVLIIDTDPCNLTTCPDESECASNSSVSLCVCEGELIFRNEICECTEGRLVWYLVPVCNTYFRVCSSGEFIKLFKGYNTANDKYDYTYTSKYDNKCDYTNNNK